MAKAKPDPLAVQRGIRFTAKQMRALKAESERLSADGINVTIADVVRVLINKHLIGSK